MLILLSDSFITAYIKKQLATQCSILKISHYKIAIR